MLEGQGNFENKSVCLVTFLQEAITSACTTESLLHVGCISRAFFPPLITLTLLDQQQIKRPSMCISIDIFNEIQLYSLCQEKTHLTPPAFQNEAKQNRTY